LLGLHLEQEPDGLLQSLRTRRQTKSPSSSSVRGSWISMVIRAPQLSTREPRISQTEYRSEYKR
jgi:hypothetical protein